MSNGLYAAAGALILGGGLNWGSDTLSAGILDAADYTPNLASHDFYDDVPSGARVASGTLASKTTTAGTFDAADLVLSSVVGDPTELVLLWRSSGAESAQNLIILWDTGVSVTPNGGNITLQWHANGIYDTTP